MDEQAIANQVADRLGVNDGRYEFFMEHYQKILRRNGIKLNKYGYFDYKPGKSVINLIKFIRNTPGFFSPEMPGLKRSKDCVEGCEILVGYFTAKTRDEFVAELKTFDIRDEDFIFTKKEEKPQ